MPTKRPAIPPRTRLDVYRRDGWSCRFCGEHLPVSRMTIDHLIPLSRGGHPTDRRNLVAACASCNQRKGNRTPYEARMVVLPMYAGGPVPPGWRAGQSQHPRKIIPVVASFGAPLSRVVALTDPVHLGDDVPRETSARHRRSLASSP